MRKYQWLLVLILIGYISAFTGCERSKEMLTPVLPDAKVVEPPMDSVDVLIYTNRSFWIALEDAEMAAETTKSLLDSHGVQVEITKDDAYVREWMLHTTGDGDMNVIILYGVLPTSVYGPGNSEPDGSIAENWIETTDGDTILNHADYIAYNTDYDVDKWTPAHADAGIGIGSNEEGGLQNLMDNPNIILSTAGMASMIVTSDGMALTPSLVNFESFRSVPLNQLQGEWFAEKVLASDTGDAEATYADPVIVRDGDRGRLAIVHATSEHEGLLNGEVAAEIIINYLLADPIETVEMPPEEMPMMVELKKLYFADVGTATISRANPDGSDVETLITGVAPWGLALDIAGGKIYWVSFSNQRLSRANLDGTNLEVLVTGMTGEELALDLESGKVYWSGSGKIQRANLDGSGVEDVITTSPKPDGIALDLVNGKIYWTDSYDAGGELAHTIQRANLDGSDSEVLVSGLQHPQGITLDLDEGKMYWTNWPPKDNVQRANLDGTNIEDVVPGSGGLHDIVLDFSAGKIYWTDTEADNIQRANLDGSEVEEVVIGLDTPLSVALDIGPIN